MAGRHRDYQSQSGEGARGPFRRFFEVSRLDLGLEGGVG